MASETGGLAASSLRKGSDDRHDGSDADTSVPNPRRRRRGCRARGSGLMGVAPSLASGATQGDVDILIAAEIAEALAVTTYSNIIFNAPFFTRLAADDQGYCGRHAREEMSATTCWRSRQPARTRVHRSSIRTTCSTTPPRDPQHAGLAGRTRSSPLTCRCP